MFTVDDDQQWRPVLPQLPRLVDAGNLASPHCDIGGFVHFGVATRIPEDQRVGQLCQLRVTDPEVLDLDVVKKWRGSGNRSHGLGGSSADVLLLPISTPKG